MTSVDTEVDTPAGGGSGPQQDVLVVDGDGHYAENFDAWRSLVEERYRDQAPKLIDGPDGETVVWPHFVQKPKTNGSGLGDELTPGGMNEGQSEGRKWHEGWPGGFDGALRLADMDTDGIDAVVLFPSSGLVLPSIPDVDVQQALMEGLNRFAADYCQADPQRLFAVANIPLGDPQRAADVLRKAVTEQGFVAGMIRPNPYHGNKLLTDPDRDVLWATAQELDVPLTIHEGSVPVFDRLGNTRVSDPISRHVLGHPMEGMTAFTSLYMSGVFERFPRLRVGFMESGCGWLPFVGHRIDEELEMFGWQRPDLKRRAGDVIQENGIVIGAEGEDPFVTTNMDMFGDGSVIWASDYPHRDATFPGTTDDLFGRKDLSDERLAALAGGNAVKFYRLQDRLAARP